MASPYDVAIHLHAVNGVSGVLAAITKQVTGLHGEVTTLNRALSSMNTAAIGAVTGALGYAGLKLAGHFEHAGEHLVQAKTTLEAALPPAQRQVQLAEATAAAWKEAGSNLRTNVHENIEAIHDLYNVTTDMPHSIELLPAFNQLKNVQDAIRDGGGQAQSGREIANAIRGFEIAGRNTAESLKEVSHEFAQTSIALRGRVSGGQLQTQIQNSGDARYGWSDDFLTRALPALIATGLGNRTGSALYNLSNNLYGGVSSSQLQMESQIKWGLHSDDDRMDPDRKKPGFHVGTLRNAEGLAKDPRLWANDYLDFLRTQKGVDTNNVDTMRKIVGEIARGNKLLKSALDELLLPQTNRQLNKEIGNIERVGGDAQGILNDKSPKAIRDALHKQWENVKDAFGEPLVKPLMDVLKQITGVLKDLSQWAANNPETAGNIAKLFAGVSAGLVALGTIAVGGALLAMIGPAGWLVAGLTALAGLYAKFNLDHRNKNKAQNGTEQPQPGFFDTIWDGIKKDFQERGSRILAGIGEDFTNRFVGPIKTFAEVTLPNIGRSIYTALEGLGEQAKTAMSRVATDIGTALANLPSQLGSYISTMASGLASAIGNAIASAPGAAWGKVKGLFGGSAPESPAPAPGKQGALAPMGGRQTAINTHTTIKLNGREIAQATSRHIARMAMHPTQIGGMDTHSSWAAPGYAPIG